MNLDPQETVTILESRITTLALALDSMVETPKQADEYIHKITQADEAWKEFIGFAEAKLRKFQMKQAKEEAVARQARR